MYIYINLCVCVCEDRLGPYRSCMRWISRFMPAITSPPCGKPALLS